MRPKSTPNGVLTECADSKTACLPSAIMDPKDSPGQAVNRSGLIPETCGDEKDPWSAGHPEIHAVLIAAGAYREHSQAFVNLSMHEQRLYRILPNATKRLTT